MVGRVKRVPYAPHGACGRCAWSYSGLMSKGAWVFQGSDGFQLLGNKNKWESFDSRSYRFSKEVLEHVRVLMVSLVN